MNWMVSAGWFRRVAVAVAVTVAGAVPVAEVRSLVADAGSVRRGEARRDAGGSSWWKRKVQVWTEAVREGDSAVKM